MLEFTTNKPYRGPKQKPVPATGTPEVEEMRRSALGCQRLSLSSGVPALLNFVFLGGFPPGVGCCSMLAMGMQLQHSIPKAYIVILCHRRLRRLQQQNNFKHNHVRRSGNVRPHSTMQRSNEPEIEPRCCRPWWSSECDLPFFFFLWFAFPAARCFVCSLWR